MERESSHCSVMHRCMLRRFPSGFGSTPGAAISVHEAEHISIALLFFALGGIGLLLELRSARAWLAHQVLAVNGHQEVGSVEKPPSWEGSFNPFPALVIGVVSDISSRRALPRCSYSPWSCA